MSAILVLEDGTTFHGQSAGVPGTRVGEVVFNTAMSGYQEVLTDPSYCYQMVTFTYPHIGNTGINDEDMESDKIWAAGVIMRAISKTPSNWRSTGSLPDFLKAQNTLAITGIDTRALVCHLREKGALRCVLTTELNESEALTKACRAKGLEGLNLTSDVTTPKTYTFTKDTKADALHVIVYDFGVKRNILRRLSASGAKVTVVGANTKASDVLALKPDGIFLSNGPGDPHACSDIIKEIKALFATNIPMYGICLGYQLLALAFGASTQKMKFGHHGVNHPVQELETKRVYITSQNHSFMVQKDSLPKELLPTHVSLFDGTLQGFKHKSKSIFAHQGHPEASPGPQELSHFFDDFIVDITRSKEKAGV